MAQTVTYGIKFVFVYTHTESIHKNKTPSLLQCDIVESIHIFAIKKEKTKKKLHLEELNIFMYIIKIKNQMTENILKLIQIINI